MATATENRGRGQQSGSKSARKETLFEQIASFVSFFIYLLVLKSFFLPLFVIPTGSMAETLYGAHAVHTCPNCGFEYPIGLPVERRLPAVMSVVQCPNCRWQEHVKNAPPPPPGMESDGQTWRWLHKRAGDRIMVHGWPYELGGVFAPERWDVVVFKVPSDGQTNYIKRLIGLPGETIEIIDGDIFVAPPGSDELRVAAKPPLAQQSLWFPYYNHDFVPHAVSGAADYHPRWVAIEAAESWIGLDTRQPSFSGEVGRRSRIRFVTEPGPSTAPGDVVDIYGYNLAFTQRAGPRGAKIVPIDLHPVSDVRLSCDVTIGNAGDAGFVELRSSKYLDRFYARLQADGMLLLEHNLRGESGRNRWGETRIPVERLAQGVRLALSCADYRVTVAVDGQPVLFSTPEQYSVSADVARQRGNRAQSPVLEIAAGGVAARFRHLLIERDVYYAAVEIREDGRVMPGCGVAGNPIQLRENDYYVLGDNSPASLDSRFHFAQRDQNPVGPHLLPEYVAGAYQLGTVPGDQLLGPAFFIYWPGTAALLPDENLPQGLRLLNHLPNIGRIRWIH